LQHFPDQVENQTISTAALVDDFVSPAMRNANDLQGGFGNTRKLPNVARFNALIDCPELAPGTGSDVTDIIQLSLGMMVSRNLRDHINVGFVRFTIDPDRYTPHFEKMLQDNHADTAGLLAALYLRAHRIWPRQD
jgi:uncharacterized protein YyaL (SSP411 family)